MKLRSAFLTTALGILATMFLSICCVPASSQSSTDLSAFTGRWQINVSKSTFNRYGPNGKNTPRGATYTFIFATQDGGLKLDVYNEYPSAKAARSMAIVADEKQHPCTGDCVAVGGAPSTPNPQNYAYSMIDSHMLTRITYAGGKVNEYLVYAVSSDGKTMTQVNWSPETPEWQNIYVFEKQQ